MNDDIERERRVARKLADERIDAADLTPAEIKNGWTVESLTKYRAERNAGAEVVVNIHGAQRRTRPSVQNSKYSPFRWR